MSLAVRQIRSGRKNQKFKTFDSNYNSFSHEYLTQKIMISKRKKWHNNIDPLLKQWRSEKPKLQSIDDEINYCTMKKNYKNHRKRSFNENPRIAVIDEEILAEQPIFICNKFLGYNSNVHAILRIIQIALIFILLFFFLLYTSFSQRTSLLLEEKTSVLIVYISLSLITYTACIYMKPTDTG